MKFTYAWGMAHGVVFDCMALGALLMQSPSTLEISEVVSTWTTECRYGTGLLHAELGVTTGGYKPRTRECVSV